MSMQDFNRNGGLTLVPMPGFIELAQNLRERIQCHPRQTQVDITVPEFGERANGEPFVRLAKTHVGGHDCVVLASGPGTYEMLMKLLLLLAYLEGRRAARIAVIFGYMPLGRSDKDEGQLEFAIASLGVRLCMSAAEKRLDRIITFDPHAPQIVMAAPSGVVAPVSLARRVLRTVIADALAVNPKICLLLPDDGAAHRFNETIAHVQTKLDMQLPVVCGQKKRINSRQSQLLGLSGDTDALPGSLVVGFDDEIATGGTLIQIAKKVIQDHEVKEFWAAAVHGVFCGEAPRLFGAYDSPVTRLYTSNTIPMAHRAELEILRAQRKLFVVDWTEDLANIIFSHHWDENIRES